MEVNVVIPMAGTGTRFSEAGFQLPKPLIEVEPRKPMIRVVIENLGIRGRYTFFCLGTHLDEQPLASMLSLVCNGRGFGEPEIVRSDEVTQGQADSVLRCLSPDFGGNAVTWPAPDYPIIVANCDQFLDAWHPGVFMDYIKRTNPDAAVLTFRGSDPKWSFCDVEPEGNKVLRTAEKEPISTRANVGIFYFKTAAMLRNAIERMMADPGMRVNGEFYLAPAINLMIADGAHVIEYPVAAMHGLGTPEDLSEFQAKLFTGEVRV